MKKIQTMTKHLLSAFLITVSSYAVAQITITKDDFPTTGSNIMMSTANLDLGIDITTTGASQSWDYSTLTRASQDNWVHNSPNALGFLAILTFGTFAPTKYIATYYRPSTAIPVQQITSFLPVTIDSIFAFTRVAIDSVNTVGYGMRVSGNTIGFRSDSIEKTHDLTATYGDSWDAQAKTLIDFNPFFAASFLQRRDRTAVVDGYGNITTPYGTFPIIRIKHTIVERDSLFYQDTIFTIPIDLAVPINLPTAYEYEWRAVGEREAILRIKTSEILGNEVVSSIEYRDIDHAGIETNESNDLFIYPNPTQNALNVKMNGIINSCSVMSINGEILQELAVGQDQLHIDFSTYAAGIYFINIISDKGTEQYRIVKN